MTKHAVGVGIRIDSGSDQAYSRRMTSSVAPRTNGLVFVAVTFVLLLLPRDSAWSQTRDHLQCYKVKRNVAAFSTTFHANLDGLAPQPGCEVRPSAKLLCVPATKTDVSPPPQGETMPGQQLARPYLCYKVRCPNVDVSQITINLSDQFTFHQLTAGTTKMLCAPLFSASSTSSSTTSTTLPAICNIPCGPVGNGECAGHCPAEAGRQCGCVGDASGCSCTCL